jgi:hypothetical protein
MEVTFRAVDLGGVTWRWDVYALWDKMRCF